VNCRVCVHSTVNTFKPTGCSYHCAQIHLLQFTHWRICDRFATYWRW